MGFDLLEGEGVGEAVGAEEVEVARFVRGDGHFGVGFGGCPYGAGDHIFVAKGGAGFKFEPLGHEGMILGEQLEFLLAEAVEAAVAYMGVDDGRRSFDKTAKGCPHSLKRFVFLAELVDVAACFFNRRFQLDAPFDWILSLNLLERAREVFDGLAGGNFSSLMASHPVGNGEKTDLRQRGPNIFIVGARGSYV